MKRVLIVDDAAFMRASLKMLLTKNGFEIVGEAEDGNAAFEQYKSLSPDVVTMDITMPNCSGIDAVKRIKGFDANARIIMISAMGKESMVVEAVMAGAKGFIVKPFNEAKVVEAVNKA